MRQIRDGKVHMRESQDSSWERSAWQRAAPDGRLVAGHVHSKFVFVSQFAPPFTLLTIGGKEVLTSPQTVVLMPANVPHAVRATEASRMLLIMLREAARP